MTALAIVGVAVFVLAILVLLVLSAAALATLVFHLMPKLQGSVLSVTGSDVVQSLRCLPTNLAYRYRRETTAPPKPILVIFALNPVREKQYLFGFYPEPLHTPRFGPDRDLAIRFDYNDDLAIQKTFQLADDRGLNVCLEFTDRMPRGFVPKYKEESSLTRMFGLPNDRRVSGVSEIRTAPEQLSSRESRV